MFGRNALFIVAAIGFIELGEYDIAASNFDRSFANAQPPFDVWTETPSGGTPNFLTGAGGFLQAVFFGYPYLRLNDTAAVFNPVLPQGSGRVTIRGMSYLGQRIDFSYNAATLTVQLQEPSTLDYVLDASAYHRTHNYGSQCHHARKPSKACEARMEALIVENEQHPLCLMPTECLATRSQQGQVVINGRKLEAASLQLIDSSGASHPITQAPLTLPLQKVSILQLVDADGTRHPLTPEPLTLPLQKVAITAAK
jgi:hypothetical protein